MKSVVVCICLCFSLLVSGCGVKSVETIESSSVPSGNTPVEAKPESAVPNVEQTATIAVYRKPAAPIPTQKVEPKKPVICIEAGHQVKGNSELEPNAPGSKTMKQKVLSGTQGIKTKKPEYQLNLEVALKLEKRLNPDYKVIMVRRSNEVDISNSERAIFCNKANADLMIRLHADGSDNHKVKGMSFLYPSLDSKYTSKVAKKSLEVIKVVSKYVIQETGAQSNGLKPRTDLTGFNWLEIPSILIEMGFMTNLEEDVLMSKPEYQDKIVAGIKAGLDSYYSY
ncbi:N-acetylmuramoyl-L-alanine amidase family protein [Paenibacillus wynnii]|uniref:N-acetylmuramoyl-L-alanine amidase family protein n=1 Tax=Paenibacillus wynnii TaxID=268407 RepID=UPI0027936EB7|nr:N-acetylmuramoyl-L-alanine amidase [Paenibacillus wynnii]MDQ0194138.1 N-acetylmuramoyl-L-alanine amidase [Paenibacillus wynnii]